MTITYKTADLKADIDNHEIRIVKLEQTSGCFEDHIQRHEDVFDPLLKKHDRALYGEHGDDGMVTTVAVMQEGYKDIKKDVATVKALEWGIIVTLIVAIIMAFIN
jgi:hypothetical protein